MSALSAEVNLFHNKKRDYVCSTERDKKIRIEWLVNRFRTIDDKSEKDSICEELDTLFEKRTLFSKRCATIYAYAKARGVIVNQKTYGWHRGKPAKSSPKKQPSCVFISIARDKLHKHCVAKKISILQEIAMGEILKIRGRNGDDIDTVLNQLLEET